MSALMTLPHALAGYLARRRPRDGQLRRGEPKDRRRRVIVTGGDPERGVDRCACGPRVAAAMNGDELGAAGVRVGHDVRGNRGGGGRRATVTGSPSRDGRGGGRDRRVTG